MIVKDIVQSHTLRKTSAGYGVDRIFIVSDVAGNAEARLYNATIKSGVPQFGDPHPVIPEIQVTDIQAAPESNDSASVKVRVTYSIPTEDDNESSEGDLASGVPVISSGLQPEETPLDIHGDFIRVRYVHGSITTTYKSINVQRPQMRVTLTRVETNIPKLAIAEYLGSINSVAWSGFKPKTWLCASINVNQDQKGWRVEYSFTYREDNWQAIVSVNIPANIIEDYPPDKQTGNGFGRFDVYPAKDFNLLGLKF